MKKVLVLGSQGMAGHVMYNHLGATGLYEVIGVARSSGDGVDHVLDVTDFEALSELLSEVRPDVVVNCIGVLLKGTSSDVANTILLNSYLPRLLASLGEKLNFKLIHISTDCVFSGKEGGYSETSFRDGDDNYARTKALGEIDDDNHLTLRTSIIGPELKQNGEGLMHWFFNQKDSIPGYTRAFWSGLTTLELAKVVSFCIEGELTGLIQPCPNKKISKYDLLGIINEVWQRDISIAANDEYVVDKSLVCTRDDFKYSIPDYRDMLIEMYAWMESHKSLYSQYNL